MAIGIALGIVTCVWTQTPAAVRLDDRRATFGWRQPPFLSNSARRACVFVAGDDTLEGIDSHHGLRDR